MNEQKVQLNATTCRAVLHMLQQKGDARSIEQVVDAALKAWLAAAAVADPVAAAAATRGYQWKSLFLPEGTQLRLFYRNDYAVATVVGDRIRFQGRHYSPRQLVMHVTGQVRNAWLTLWIHCPGDARWHLADTRRHILRRLRPDPPPVAQPTSTSAAQSTLASAAQSASTPAARPRLVLPEPAESFRAHRRASYLRRTDCVRDDQPDLSIRMPSGRGYGPFGAGRAGPRDRRAPARFRT